jgi:EAL domain-containing protein (putative c-di-GMP-specific phosphodiesterase class I)
MSERRSFETRPPSALPRVGEVLDKITSRFDQAGALGLLVLQIPQLSIIERSLGSEARHRVHEAIAELAQAAARTRLDIDDLLLQGELGVDELLLVVFREHVDARFWDRELPEFEQAFRKKVEERGTKLLYPYLRAKLEVTGGIAVALRNPKLGAETQLRKALDEARADAEITFRYSARERRREILDIVLDRRVTSVYEPIVDVVSKTVFGYEALARGPEGTSLHSPLSLFGLAEREDLVFELDCLCRESGLKGAVGLPEGTKLFLNIRPTTIHDPNFRAERLIKTLHECQLTPSDVVFEVSEQEGIENFEVFKEMRDYYRDLGFQFALDDTGAGYAGLETLIEISPEFIKVDRAFVSGIDSDPARRTLLGALRDVSDSTGARIIAEGLDTLEELETLGELNIPFGQGWLFGKPTPLRAPGT